MVCALSALLEMGGPNGQTPDLERRGIRSDSYMLTLLVGMMGIGASLASVASAQEEPVAATETAEVADAGDDADAATQEARTAGLGVGYALDKALLFLCGVLVLLIQGGSAMLDVGLGSGIIVIGGVAVALVVVGMIVLDKTKNDGPVGAASICAWAFVTMSVFLAVPIALGMLRVTPADEQAGLEMRQHGTHASPLDAIAGGAIA